MSSFDDEFGLFGEDVDEERVPTLGARTIATGETIIDDIEPEDERPRRGPRGGSGGARPAPGGGFGGPRRFERPVRPDRPPLDPEVSRARASELLLFLAKKLVVKPEEVVVEAHEGARGPVLELIVDPEDLGKVIGRGGRVAQALRTLVRASAEGRVAVDILDTDGAYEDDDEEAVGDAQGAVAAEGLEDGKAPE